VKILIFKYNIQIVYSNDRLKYFNAHCDMHYNVLKSLLTQMKPYKK